MYTCIEMGKGFYTASAPHLQRDVMTWAADALLWLQTVFAGQGNRGLVEAPVFLPLQLQDEDLWRAVRRVVSKTTFLGELKRAKPLLTPTSHLNVVVMWRQPLGLLRGDVHIRPNQGAKEALQLLLDVPQLVLNTTEKKTL